MTTQLEELYQTLSGRYRPEDVAERIVAAHPGLTLHERRALIAGRRVWRRLSPYGSTSLMPTAFAKPLSLEQTCRAIAEILGLPVLSSAEAADPARVRALLAVARERIGMAAGRSDFLADRLNRAARRQLGIDLSRRQYNKVFRAIGRMEAEVVDLEQQQEVFSLMHFAKTGFAPLLSWEQFASNLNSAAFVAYMSATLGRRSAFTNGPQARAFDKLAALLLGRCERDGADWYAVAHVFPRADVLARVSVDDRLALLGRTLAILKESAALLRLAWQTSDIDLETMIVRRGNDSSTWNALAGAWNRARDYWIALIQSLGLDATLERFLPGKVLRLMAADVVWWHRISGGTLSPDTQVWAALPKPWEVLEGEATCTRAMIAEVCLRHGIDADRTGWTAARPRVEVAAWEPTPDRVHGIAVADPLLAYWLRKVGVFSGKPLKLGALGPLQG